MRINKIFDPAVLSFCQEHRQPRTPDFAPTVSPVIDESLHTINESLPTTNQSVHSLSMRGSTALAPSVSGIDMSAQLPFDPEASKKTMPNGMTYIIRHHDHPTKGTACLRLVIRAGSVDEKEGQQGLAHFLEHLSFCRTENYGRNDLIRFLEKAGADFGLHQNAHTDFNEIVYKFDIPITDVGLLDQALEILREMTTKITLTQETLDEERQVVLDEILNESEVDRLLKKQFAMILNGTPYAERFPKGLKEVVENCKPEQIIEFHQRLYQPNNMGIAVVADCDPAEVEKLILKHFSDIPASTQPANEHRFTPEVCTEPQFLCFADPECTTSSVAIMHLLPKTLFPKEPTGHAYKRLEIKELAFKMISRRYDESYTDRPNSPFINWGCQIGETFCPGTHLFALGVQAKDGQIPEALKQGLLELKRIQQHGFLPFELKQIKRQLLSDYEKQAREANHRTTKQIVEDYEKHLSDGTPAPDLLQKIELCKILLEQITLDEINQWVHQHITNRGVIIISKTPLDEKSLVTEETLRAVMKEVEEAQVVPYQSTYVDRPLLRNPTNPGKIVSTRYHEKTKITEHHLENGMRVFIKSNKQTNNTVYFKAISLGGQRSSPFTPKKVALLADSVFNQNGQGGFTLGQLKDYLRGKEVSLLKGFINNYTSCFKGSSSVLDIDTLFQLANCVFTDPSYREETFKKIQVERINLLSHEEKDPDILFDKKLIQLWTQDHPAFKPLDVSDVENSKYEPILEFLKAQYANPANFDLFIVGNIEPDQIQPYLEKYLAGIPQKGPRQTQFNYPLMEFPQGIVTEEIDGRLQSSSKTHFTFYTVLEDMQEDRCFADFTAHLVEKRLVDVLRFEEGTTYSPRSFVAKTPFPGFHKHWPSTAQITAGSPPEYIEEVKTKILQVIKEIQEEGFTPEELAKVKAIFKESLRERWNYDASWMDEMEEAIDWGVDLDESDKIKELSLEKFTLEDAQKMMKRLYSLDRYVQLTRNPPKSSLVEEKIQA